jgi:pSer/pThr/pTyr-binding forkhead associated (FHA) protein
MAEALLECRMTAVTSPPEVSLEPLQLSWEGRRLRLDATPVSIGAHGDNAVCLADRFVSSFHCRIEAGQGRARVRDLGSTNGTFVDGLRVTEAELGAGSRL